eukprot:249229-Karenia_brevis.AAC.1
MHCVVHTSLMKLSYSNPNQQTAVEVQDVGDLALCFCEYSCALATVRKCQGICGSDAEVARWILKRIPDDTAHLQKLRRA